MSPTSKLTEGAGWLLPDNILARSLDVLNDERMVDFVVCLVVIVFVLFDVFEM